MNIVWDICQPEEGRCNSCDFPIHWYRPNRTSVKEHRGETRWPRNAPHTLHTDSKFCVILSFEPTIELSIIHFVRHECKRNRTKFGFFGNIQIYSSNMSSRKVSRAHFDEEAITANAMSLVAEGHFRGMKELLSSMDLDTDANTIKELKERAHMLCARFLGGAWKTVPFEHLRISRIKGGMSNMLFLCRLSEVYPPIRNEPNKVLLRVYFNPETESHLVAESVIFTLLSERHLGPKLYGIFSGGRLEEYIPSRPLTCHEISLSNMSTKIAKRLAKVHQLEVPIWKEPDYLCEALQRWLKQLSSTVSGEHRFSLPEDSIRASVTSLDLFKELEFLRTHISKSKSPVTFCHNDLQEGNILLPKASSGNIRMPSVSDDTKNLGNSLSAFNPSDPRLVLIDFEYASYNYRAFDFANHFVEWTIDYDVDEDPYYKIEPANFPSNEAMLDFFVNYLRELGGTRENELYKKAESLVSETLPFVPVSHFLWGVWGLLQVELSPVGFGFAEYGRDRLALYFKHKHLLEALENES